MAAASATARVASMPCSPATARSRARWTSYAARSASWSTASAFSSSAWPYFSACVGVRLVPRHQLAHRPDRRALGQRGQVGVEVAGELVQQHRRTRRSPAALAPRRARHRCRVARRGRRRNTSASCSCKFAGLGRQCQADAAQGVRPRPLAVRLAGQHAEQGRRVGDGAAHRPGAVLAGRDGQDSAARHQAEGRLDPDQALVVRAGTRIEPSVSVPTVTVASPSAAAAPDPELEPLGVRLTS